jgi:hypothetical protein
LSQVANVEPNQLQTEWSHNTLKHSEVLKATALAEFLVDWSSDNALIMPTTMVLGIVTAPHAVIARYPSKMTTPAKLYRPAIRRSRHCLSSAWLAPRS